MPEEKPAASKARWIVLLNKSPKGPLTEEDVRTLIDQKLLRLNDAAFQITEGEAAPKSEWKFLWQFPEFNRRNRPQPEAAAKAADASMAPPANRRAEISDEEAKRQLMENLPADLASIRPEDLVGRAQKHHVHGHQEPEPEQLSDLPTGGGARRWFPLGAALGVGVFALYIWLGSRPVTPPGAPVVPARDPGSTNKPRTSLPPRGVGRPAQPQVAVPEPIPERDRPRFDRDRDARPADRDRDAAWRDEDEDEGYQERGGAGRDEGVGQDDELDPITGRRVSPRAKRRTGAASDDEFFGEEGSGDGPPGPAEGQPEDVGGGGEEELPVE